MILDMQYSRPSWAYYCTKSAGGEAYRSLSTSADVLLSASPMTGYGLQAPTFA